LHDAMVHTGRLTIAVERGVKVLCGSDRPRGHERNDKYGTVVGLRRQRASAVASTVHFAALLSGADRAFLSLVATNARRLISKRALLARDRNASDVLRKEINEVVRGRDRAYTRLAGAVETRQQESQRDLMFSFPSCPMSTSLPLSIPFKYLIASHVDHRRNRTEIARPT